MAAGSPKSLSRILHEKKAELERRLAEAGLASSSTSAIPRRAQGSGPHPVSASQERLWLLERLDPGTSVYNVPAPVRLRGPLDVPALRSALDRLVERHEVLRTTFVERDGVPAQRIHAPAAGTLSEVDLTSLAASDREPHALAQARELAATPFDLERGPLFKAALWKLGDADHLLLLSFHHAIFDVWSLGIVARELEVLYAAARGTTPAALEPPALQYADFALWQREWLAGDGAKGDLDYWRAKLAGPLPVLELPADRPRKARTSSRGAWARRELAAEVAEGALELARREGVTAYMVFLSAAAAFLARITGAPELCIGSPVAGRTRRELETLPGFFVNTVVQRLRVDLDAGFRALVAHVRETALEAFAHQEAPFERVLEGLALRRDPAHRPVFQVLFDHGHVRAGALALEGGASGEFLGPEVIHNGGAKVDLALFTYESGSRVALCFEYDAELFDRETMERWLADLETLLAAALAELDRPLGRLALLAPQERTLVIERWNATAVEIPREKTVHELVLEWALRTPGKEALRFAGRSTSYRELEARANKLARHLWSSNVRRGDRVALALERSDHMIVAMLGILKSGACYVPLDPAYPRERLEFMLADSGAQVLVTEKLLDASLPATRVRVRIDSDAAAIGAREETPLPRTSGPDDPCYLVYTSGTTGVPKGVAVPHRGVVRLLRGSDWMRLSPDMRTIHLAPISFDAHILDIWSALVNGGTVVPLAERTPSLELLERTIRDERIDRVFFTTALFNTIVDERPALLTPLAEVAVGGEALSLRHVRLAQAHLPQLEIVNCYGPTETSVIATRWRVPRPLSTDVSVAPIGQPIANTSVYVLDERGELVPIGVPGELHVGGPGVALGYLGRAELTAERFLPDPFSADPAARIYRTGDLVRWTRAGELEYLGRGDFQVKIRGHRIELGEVEHALGSHPDVAQNVVVARPDASGAKALVAYAVLREGSATTGPELRQFLAARLPESMRPAALVLLDELPRTPVGKIDRKALPDPAVIEATGAELVAPRSPTEELVAGLFAELLKRERVSVADDFFELGGHSLLATILVARLKDALGIEIALRELFAMPTPAALAAAIAAKRRDAGSPPPRAIERAGEDARTPLSYAQKSVWFFQTLAPESPFFAIPVAVSIDGELDPGALERALAWLVERHGILRATYAIEDGEPLQRITPPPAARPAEGTLLPLVHAASRAEAMALAEAAARRPFDLARGPLLRAELLRISPREHWLVLVVHHIVCDGWSFEILLAELASAYATIRSGGSPAANPLPVGYGDYVRWQSDRLAEGDFARALAQAKGMVAGAPPLLELPLDRQRPGVQSFKGATERMRLPRELTLSLRAFAKKERCTLFMALLAAWQANLARHTHQKDFVLGTLLSGRTASEIEHVVGLFINTVALRAELGDDPSFRTILARVKAATLHAHDWQDLPYELLVEELAPERTAAYTPLVQSIFTLRSAGTTRESAGVRFLPPREILTGTAKTDLAIAVEEHGDELEVVAEYATDLFDGSSVRRWLAHYQNVLVHGIAEPDTRLGKLCLLEAAEREQVLFGWNTTAEPYPREAAVHELFEEQVDRTPDAVALVFEGATMSWRELDGRANRLAHYLRAQGVGRDVLVGISVERGFDMIIGILSVLKAGGAYVPLDPQYPSERLALILDDSAPRLLLTQTRVRERLPQRAIPLLSLDALPSDVERASDARLGRTSGPEDLFNVLYTSGSTGRPKGVLGVQRAYVNRLDWQFRELPWTSEDVACQKTTLNFVDSVCEIFGPLCRGVRLVLIPDGKVRDPVAIVRIMQEQRVTRIVLVPSLLQSMLDNVPDLSARLAHLRHCLIGGEALTNELWRSFHAALPGARLVNIYGASEVAADVTAYDAIHGEAMSGVPIGRPIQNSRAYILDEHLEPVPIGVTGDLYAGGDCLGRGYLNQPELTAQAFRADPFVAGERLYRMGDLARFLPDGRIEYLGRRDHQVKIRGFRIELGEVESNLLSHPEVQTATVLAPEIHGERRLVAYVVPKAPGTPASSFASFLREKLPDYMVPAHFVLLERMPLTPNGKIDRRALPPPSLERVEADAPRTAARSEVEALLVEVWERVLKTSPIGVDDDFFELGGHSLLAVRLLAEVKDTFGQELPLASLIAAPTIADQGQLIHQGIGSLDSSPLVKIQTKGARPPFFCVCSIGGTVLNQRPLARLLGEDQPFYGLQAVDLDALLGREATIEDFAAHYLSIVREVRPHGPYMLGGHSFGAMVAYEMARQLDEQGEQVALLAMLDSGLPNLGKHTLADQVAGFAAFLRGVPYLPVEIYDRFKRDPEQLRRELKKRASFSAKVIGAKLGLGGRDARAIRSEGPGSDGRPIGTPRSAPGHALAPLAGPMQGNPVPASASSPAGDETWRRLSPEDFLEMSQWPEHNRRIAARHFRAVLAYQPQPYCGTVTLFRGRRQPLFYGRGFRMGWEKRAPSVEVHVVPGSHLSLLAPPHVNVLARKLDLVIRAKLAQSVPPTLPR